MNTKFQNALNLVPQDCPPIWFMRQAGRYHDHYQKLKEKYTFKDLCTQPELAAKTAMGPIEDFDFDASIYFNDILYPLEALGFNLEYAPGPKMSPVLDANFMGQLKSSEEAREFLQFQKNAVAATREILPSHKSLIGFIGGPWTLFTYAIECAHKGHLIASKTNIALFHQFMNHLLPVLENCIEDQLQAGAEIVMVFDTSAGVLAPSQFQECILPVITRLTTKFPTKLGYYAKESTIDQVMLLQDLPLAGRGFDHRFNLKRRLTSEKRAGFIQGNFDQTLLFSDPKDFKSLALDYLAPLKELTNEQRAGWVSGLGHGVLPKTPQENVRTLIQTIREQFNG